VTIHLTAVIGDPPEHREHSPWDASISPLISSSARVEAFVTVDAGITRPTTIGDRVWLMKHVHVGHDAIIMDDCEIAPHTSVGGHVTISRGVRVGQGALFKPFVSVGEGARIGMGAVVIHDVPAGEVWAGNPARRIDAPRPLVGAMTASEMEGWECYFGKRSEWPSD
jgi:acyl-[acyl carrier protein]--UDP-N-acetylglucosamine O-acyltransferase